MKDNAKTDLLELWTIEECANWLRVSPEGVRCRIKRGQFPKETYVHVGRKVRFIAQRVREWLFKQVA